jgi:hypothetical protein
MCLAGIIPVAYFAIDDLTLIETRKARAFGKFIHRQRHSLAFCLVAYAIISVFVVNFGWDFVSSLAFLTPIPAATSFGVGIGIAIASMRKAGE